MIAATLPQPAPEIVYPESDGLPMAENTRQLNWIIALVTNLRALFRDKADVFIAGNQFWYPVKDEPDICNAPDVYAVFGRPKGNRPSYKQWEEDGIPMTVVFEVLSPGNRFAEMADKFTFYEEYGVEEYFIYDPDDNQLVGYVRRGDALKRCRPINGFVSPRLGIRFDLSGPELVVRYPDGQPFLTFEELAAERDHLAAERDHLAAERDHLAAERDHLAAERDKAEQRAARLATLSGKLLRQQATAEELQELQRLLEPTHSTETR
jgi:Uma2 family endonuclease